MAPTSTAWRAADDGAPADRGIHREARVYRRPAKPAGAGCLQEMPELSADLDVTARGSAHAPTRRPQQLDDYIGGTTPVGRH